MPLNHRVRLLFSTALLSLPAISTAQEVIDYRYDGLGRLVETRVSGGARDGLAATTNFDPAGNRTNYNVSGATGVTPPAPPPPPPPTNRSPMSVADATLDIVTGGTGVRNVLFNDTDPDGDLPLSFVITGGSGAAFAVKEDAESIRFNAPQNLAQDQLYSVIYRITDSRGASIDATLLINIANIKLIIIPINGFTIIPFP